MKYSQYTFSLHCHHIIFFPISSCINRSSTWVSYQNLLNYFKVDSNRSKLFFKNNRNLCVDIKYNMIERIDSIVQRQAEVKHAQEWLDWYLECWEKCVESNPNGLVYFDYKNSDKSLFRQAENGVYSDIPAILNSARNVEQTSGIYFVKR